MLMSIVTPHPHKERPVAKITQVNDADAPAPPYKPQGKMAKQSHDILAGLTKGKTTTIELEDGESIQGMRTSLTRIANKADTKIQMWANEDRTVLYIRPL